MVETVKISNFVINVVNECKQTQKNVLTVLVTLNDRTLSFSKSQFLKTTWWTTPGSTAIVEFCAGPLSGYLAAK